MMRCKTRAFALLLCFVCLGARAELNFYVETIVSDADKYRQSIDRWMNSDDAAKAGAGLTLFSVTSNGNTPATHVVVAKMDDYTGIDRMQSVTATSKDWKRLQKAVAPIRQHYTEGHALELATYGTEGWKPGDHLAAIAMNVRDPKTYAAALDALMKTKAGQKAPGMVRLMKTLEQGKVTHYVLVSAPSFARLNRYLDSLRESEGFADFQALTEKVRNIVAIRFIKVEAVWE